MPLDFIGYTVVNAWDEETGDRFLCFYDRQDGRLTHRVRLAPEVAREIADGLIADGPEELEGGEARFNGSGQLVPEEPDQRVPVREDEVGEIGPLIEAMDELRDLRAADRTFREAAIAAALRGCSPPAAQDAARYLADVEAGHAPSVLAADDPQRAKAFERLAERHGIGPASRVPEDPHPQRAIDRLTDPGLADGRHEHGYPGDDA